jgi:hypothetical protein
MRFARCGTFRKGPKAAASVVSFNEADTAYGLASTYCPTSMFPARNPPSQYAR